MTEPFFFDGDEEDDEPDRSLLEQLSFGIGGAIALFAALSVVVFIIILGVSMIDFGQWFKIPWGEGG
jgi:hypothetical protein